MMNPKDLNMGESQPQPLGDNKCQDKIKDDKEQEDESQGEEDESQGEEDESQGEEDESQEEEEFYYQREDEDMEDEGMVDGSEEEWGSDSEKTSDPSNVVDRPKLDWSSIDVEPRPSHSRQGDLKIDLASDDESDDGFVRGRVVERVIGSILQGRTRLFAVKWVGRRKFGYVTERRANQHCPGKILDFLSHVDCVTCGIDKLCSEHAPPLPINVYSEDEDDDDDDDSVKRDMSTGKDIPRDNNDANNSDIKAQAEVDEAMAQDESMEYDIVEELNDSGPMSPLTGDIENNAESNLEDKDMITRPASRGSILGDLLMDGDIPDDEIGYDPMESHHI